MKSIKPTMLQERLSLEKDQALVSLARTPQFVGSLEEQEYSLGITNLFTALLKRQGKLYNMKTRLEAAGEQLETEELAWYNKSNELLTDE